MTAWDLCVVCIIIIPIYGVPCEYIEMNALHKGLSSSCLAVSGHEFRLPYFIIIP